MTPNIETVVFLHGVGVGPDSWNAQIANLPDGFVGIAPWLMGLRDVDSARFTVSDAASAMISEIDARGLDRVHLCGLSLGAVVAAYITAKYPDRVSSLTLSGGQVRPNPTLMAIQNVIIHLLPARLASAPGLGKKRMIGVLSEVAATDLRPDLKKISAPTLVMVGAKDRPNLSAAREIASRIHDAKLEVVRRAGHQWNTQLPDEFSRRLNRFLADAATQPGASDA